MPLEQPLETHLPYPLQHLRPDHPPPPFRTVLKPDRSRATKTGQITSQLHTSSTWIGNTTRKVDPSPGTESTEIVPPCISTIRFEIARPNPVPPCLRVLELSICWNSSKIRS